MTKNTIGGKGHKRAKKQVVDLKNIPLKNDNEDTDYAIITSVLGNGRMKVLCLGDKKERLGHIRGALYKKSWMAKDDVVLISIRDFQMDRCDIIFKYSGDEVKTLMKNGEIDYNYNSNKNEEEDDDLIFVDDENNDENNKDYNKDYNKESEEINIDEI